MQVIKKPILHKKSGPLICHSPNPKTKQLIKRVGEKTQKTKGKYVASRVYPVHSWSNAAQQESPLVSQPEETFSAADTNLSFGIKTVRLREIEEIPTPLGY